MLFKKISSFLLVGTMAATAATAYAESETVKSVTFNYSANAAKQTIFQVKQQNGQLKLMTNNVNMKVGNGKVLCENKYNYLGSALYLGPANQGGAVNHSAVYAEDDTVSVAYESGNILESGGDLIFNLAINNKVKQYFDPAAIIEAEKQKAIQGGESSQHYLSKDHEYTVKRTMVLLGSCRHQKLSKYNQSGYELVSKSVDFKIKYTGTPAPKVSIKLGNMPNNIAKPIKLVAVPLGGNGQINSPYGVNISSGQLISSIPNYVGHCPKDIDFQAQFSGSGKGKVQIHIKRNGQAVYTSQKFAYNGGNIQHHFNVKAEKHGKPLNQKQNFSFSMYMKTQAKPSDPWSADWKYMDGYQWSQTCTPFAGINAAVGNVGGINAPKPAAPKMNFKAQPVNPAPKPKRAQ